VKNLFKASNKKESDPECTKSFIAGTLISLALCLPYAITIISSSHLSPAGFQDWDEPLYVLILKKIGAYSFKEIFDSFPQTPTDFYYLPRFYSHSLMDLLLGKAVVFLGLHSLDILFALDLILVFSSFYCFYKLFLIVASPAISRLGAAVAVGLPYIPSLFEGWIPINLGHGISTAAIEGFPSLPSMRGIYTQLSIPAFVLCLRWFLILILERDSKPTYSKLILGGAILGGLIYIYVFSWITLVSLASVLTALVAITYPSSAKLTLLKGAVVVITITIVGLPGAVLNLGMRSAMSMGKGVGGPFPLWLPLEYLVLLTFIFFCARQLKDNNKTPWSLLFVSLLLTEIALGNLEGVTQTIWTSYHFSLFFLRPLLAGIIFISIFERIEKIGSGLVFRSLLPILIMAYGVIHGTKAYSTANSSSQSADMLGELNNKLPGKAVLAAPFYSTTNSVDIDALIEPFLIEAITGKSVHFAQPEFKELFPEDFEFNLLRTTLMNRGQTPGFCRANNPEVMLNAAQLPIARWGRIETLKLCQKISVQLERVCQEKDWKWFPTHLLSDEAQLEIRSGPKVIEHDLLKLPAQRVLVELSSSKERDIICAPRLMH